MVERREAMGRTAVRMSRDAAGLRERMVHTATAVERMRSDGAHWDEDIGRLTEALRAQRKGIEQVTHGRLAMVIRMAGVVSKAARFAFLWR